MSYETDEFIQEHPSDDAINVNCISVGNWLGTATIGTFRLISVVAGDSIPSGDLLPRRTDYSRVEPSHRTLKPGPLQGCEAPRPAFAAAIIFLRNEFPMPGQQSLWRDDPATSARSFRPSTLAVAANRRR
jgi:hypothetical protein